MGFYAIPILHQTPHLGSPGSRHVLPEQVFAQTEDRCPQQGQGREQGGGMEWGRENGVHLKGCRLWWALSGTRSQVHKTVLLGWFDSPRIAYAVCNFCLMKLVNWEERSDNFLGLCDTLVGFCHWWSSHQRPGVVASSCAAKAFPVCLIFSAVQTAAFKPVKDRPHLCLLYGCFVFLMPRLCFSGAGTQQAPALYRFTSLT